MFKPIGNSQFCAVLVTAVQCNLPGGGDGLRVVNRGAGDVALLLQSDAAANIKAVLPAAAANGPAANVGMLILANAPAEVLQLPIGVTGVSLIGSANASVYLTRGHV